MKFNALTYNMSWATQLNKAAGTEKDFVERCQKIYKNCIGAIIYEKI